MNKMNDPVNIQLAPFFNARKNFYQFIYHLFTEPSQLDYFQQIQEKCNLVELENINEGGKILKEFLDELTNKQLCHEIEEYQRLFLGPGQLGAPLWESFYRSKDHLLFEEFTYQVRTKYHQHNLQYRKENNEPDDHLLLEIEFMIFLIDKSLFEENNADLLNLLTDQIQFLEEHLTLWIPAFLNQLQENTNSKLYIGAAMLLNDFLKFDLQALNEVKEVLVYV